MEMKIVATSVGFTLPLKKGSIGGSVANGIALQFKVGGAIHNYAISNPISVGVNGGTLGFTILGTDWFTATDPNNNKTITNMNGMLAQIDASSAFGLSKVDINFTLYDSNNQPFYSISKVSVPSKGFSISGFIIRGILHQQPTVYKIHNP